MRMCSITVELKMWTFTPVVYRVAARPLSAGGESVVDLVTLRHRPKAAEASVLVGLAE